MNSQIYISPDGFVLAVKEVANDPVYSLERGKWYKLGRNPTNTHYRRPSKETVFIQQKHSENTNVLVQYNVNNFLTIGQWREDQIEKLIG